MPAMPHNAAGPRIEPPVSVPMPPRISPAATPAPVPLLLPAVKCPVFQGLRAGEIVDERRLGHIAPRLAHPLRHRGKPGIDRLQLRLLVGGQVEPGAGEQKFEGLVGDFGHERILLAGWKTLPERNRSGKRRTARNSGGPATRVASASLSEASPRLAHASTKSVGASAAGGIGPRLAREAQSDQDQVVEIP